MARGRLQTATNAAAAVEAWEPVVGRRYLRLIEAQLQWLHGLPAHGNRQVFLDHLVVAHLIAFFNPTVRGLRTIEDVFDDPRLRERLRLPRMPKSTVADAQQVFDPECLRPLLDSLRERAGARSGWRPPPNPRAARASLRLDELTRQLIAVDGTFLTVASRIAWAIFNRSGKGAVRLHVQFNVFDGLPDQVTLTDGQAGEAGQLRQHLRPGCFFVLDRGFHDYSLLQDILEAQSDFVVRLRQSARLTPQAACPLTAADRSAGVFSDTRVELGWRASQTPALPPLRLVEVHSTDRAGQPQVLRLLTNRLDLPAWMIALIYQHRWQVELFFRWLKCVAQFKHFFSESQRGMTLQVYITLIGLLLIAIETGAKPSKYDYALLAGAVNGLISLDSALQIAARRRAERERARRQEYARRACAKNRP